jgi:hypothetical protein
MKMLVRKKLKNSSKNIKNTETETSIRDTDKNFSKEENGFKPSYGSSEFKTGEEFYQFLRSLKL